MKKLLLIAVSILISVAMAVPVYAQANVTADWISGDLVYKDKSGNIIARWDGVNRQFEIPSGSALDIESGGALEIAGTAITPTAAEINKLASIGTGTILTTAKALTLAIAATHVFDTTADWVLSAAEKLCTLLVGDSGSGGASIVDSGGVAGTIRILRNDGDGTFTIKESGQTGIAVASGKTAVVMHNGTDYIRITADATH